MDLSGTYAKTEFVCFINMQQQNVKFKFVQINVKQSPELPVYDEAANLVNFMLMSLTNCNSHKFHADFTHVKGMFMKYDLVTNILLENPRPCHAFTINILNIRLPTYFTWPS